MHRQSTLLEIMFRDHIHKSSESRLVGMEKMVNFFKHQSLTEFIKRNFNYVIMYDAIEYSIACSSGREKVLASQLAVLMIAHLPDCTGPSEYLNYLLETNASNKLIEDRSCVLTSLAEIYFFGRRKVESDGINLCQELEEIFAEGYDEEVADDEHVAALNAWILLLTLIPSSELVQLVQSEQILADIDGMIGFLENGSYKMQVAAGCAFMILLESGRKHDKDFLSNHLKELVEVTKRLSRQSVESDEQENFYREMFRYFSRNVVTETTVTVGKGFDTNQLVLKTWTTKYQYKSILNVIGSKSQLMTKDFVCKMLQLSVDQEAAFDIKLRDQRRLQLQRII